MSASTSDGETALKNRPEPSARRATLWATAGHVGAEVLRLLNNIVMARLLSPSAFGLMALVNTFVQGLKMFSDLGIGMNIIQSSRSGEAKFLDTAWTLQVIRGCSLFAILAVFAWPVARFYGHGELAWVLVATGFGVLIAGFNSTGMATRNRDLRLDQLTRMQMTAQVLSIAVMIGWAWLWPSVWAFVVGSLVSSAVTMFLSHRLDPTRRDRFAWDAAARAELISFGRWIFLSTALTFLAGQADRLILGKLVSLETLGLYGIALALSRVSEQLVTVLSHQVLFPILSRQKLVNRDALRDVLLRHRRKLLLALGGMATVPICAGDLIVEIIYPARYADAGAMLSTLSWAGWVVGLTVTGKQALFAIGAPKYNAFATGARFVLILVGLPLAFAQGGLHSAVLLMVGAEVPVYVVNSIGMRRHGLGCLRQDVALTAALLVVVALMLGFRHLLGWGFPWAGL